MFYINEINVANKTKDPRKLKFLDERDTYKFVTAKQGRKNQCGEEEERRCCQVRLSVKNYLSRSSSQVHHNLMIQLDHRLMRAAMKKKMVLPAKFARSPGQNWQRNVEIGFNAIHAMNISSTSAMTREIFPQTINFYCSICVGS